MYDSIMSAFGAGQTASPLDVEEERRKLTAELIAEQITKEHPKVKDIVAEALLSLQERMHEHKERSMREMHAMEKEV